MGDKEKIKEAGGREPLGLTVHLLFKGEIKLALPYGDLCRFGLVVARVLHYYNLDAFVSI